MVHKIILVLYYSIMSMYLYIEIAKMLDKQINSNVNFSLTDRLWDEN